jgi:hypothetical protein
MGMFDYNERILALVTQRRLAQDKLDELTPLRPVGFVHPDIEQAQIIELKKEIHRYQRSIDAYIYGHGVAE